MNEDVIQIHRPGTIVRISGYGGDYYQVARILDVKISSNGVLYCVAWWDGADRKEAWVYPDELELDVNNSQKMIDVLKV